MDFNGAAPKSAMPNGAAAKAGRFAWRRRDDSVDPVPGHGEGPRSSELPAAHAAVTHPTRFARREGRARTGGVA
jgi:hypothetical protein